MSQIILDLCCNNPNNGDFLGRVCSIELPEGSLKVSCGDIRWGVKLAIEKNHIKFGRIAVPITGHKTWYGNWCWDAVWVSCEDAVKILNYIRKLSDWMCEGGWCDVCDPYEAGTLTAEILERELGAGVRS